MVNQVHGNDIVSTDSYDEEHPPQADGILNRDHDKGIAIKTADCLPVMIFTEDLHLALHAGWRGLVANIIGKGVAVLQQQSSTEHFNLAKVVIGPALCPNHFEVDYEVVDALSGSGILKERSDLHLCFFKGARDRKWHIDLKLSAYLQLLTLGFTEQQIFVSDVCTYCQPDQWPSYRRQGEQAGRIYSSLAFKES